METDFLDFHGVRKLETNSNFSNDEEMMKDHLEILESLKKEEISSWGESDMSQFNVGKEDFQQIMSEWQQHLGLLQSSEPEDMGLDENMDLLNTDLFEEIKESPILSKALTSPVYKSLNNTQSVIGSLDIKQEFEYPTSNEFNENYLISPIEQKVYPNIKTEPGTVVRKITLINGEKEIRGKNIIGLHCLNEIQENPDENCQVTRTVINGKRYKIIIKPKSQKAKRMSEEKIRKTLIKKLSQYSLVPKEEPKEDDEIISEMCNGNYDVPMLGNDLLSSWDMSSLDAELNQLENDVSDFITTSVEEESQKKVPPLKIKIPKLKKLRKKKSDVKSDCEEIDVETVHEKGIEASSLTDLLENFEGKVKDEDIKEEPEEMEEEKDSVLTNENIKNSLPKEMIDRIEALRRKKDGRIPLIQAIPTKKAVKNGTRMQDAVITMNRNKLLKIVSGGDTVQLDHDYCSNLFKNAEKSLTKSKLSESEANLSEKNPKKDSGLESGDVSDASEEPHTPESLQNVQARQEMNNKLLIQRQRNKDHASITKVAAEFFRATNATKSNCSSTNSDTVKTKTVSNGNKALTNNILIPSKADSDDSVIVPSNSDVSSNNSASSNDDSVVKTKEDCNTELNQTNQQTVRPKRKLKLEEYLSRKKEKKINDKVVSASSNDNDIKSSVEIQQNDKTNFTENVETNTAEKPKPEPELKQQQIVEVQKNVKGAGRREEPRKPIEKTRKRQYRSRRSSSSSSERDERRKRSRSKSRSRSRSWRNSSRKESQGRYRYSRRSLSRDRRRSLWSRSLSRSTSRESSTSSDRSGRWKRSRSPIRYRRRSRSRSVSRDRSRSRNRGYSNRNRPYYLNRNFNNRRSRSPFRIYTVREKQRQIEERRVIYVGRIEEGMTNAKLRERFSIFGPIIDISLHFREQGDNYGFVTYAYKSDAYDAVEHGNDDPTFPRYDLCFGGRRGFCKERYADLDGMPTSYSGFNDAPVVRSSEESFDLLLKEAQAKLKKRKNNKT